MKTRYFSFITEHIQSYLKRTAPCASQSPFFSRTSARESHSPKWCSVSPWDLSTPLLPNRQQVLGGSLRDDDIISSSFTNCERGITNTRIHISHTHTHAKNTFEIKPPTAGWGEFPWWYLHRTAKGRLFGNCLAGNAWVTTRAVEETWKIVRWCREKTELERSYYFLRFFNKLISINIFFCISTLSAHNLIFRHSLLT